MSIPSVNGAISSAQKMLECIQGETPWAQAIRDGDSSAARISEFDKQNILRAQLIATSWRKVGRQVLAMHPEVVDEVKVASSDKIPAEILRVLPYINPMVVFSEPPMFQTWIGRNAYHGKAETAMRLLGFFTCGSGTHVVQQDGQMAGIEQRIYASTDTTADTFTTMPVFEAIDEFGHVVDTEINTMSIRFDFTGTLADTVDDLMERFRWFSEPGGDQLGKHHRRWMREVLSTVIGSLFYLCSTTLEVEQVPPKMVAKKLSKRVVRTPISVYRVGWTTGSALTRLRQERTYSTSEQADITHQQDPQHRRAHFKMQPYGPNSSLRKLIFVSPYWTHIERLGMEGTNTARAVPRVNGKGDARQGVDNVLNMSNLPVEVS